LRAEFIIKVQISITL